MSEKRRKNAKLQPDGTYRCSKCQECKPADEFNRCKTNAVTARCRACLGFTRPRRLGDLSHPAGMRICAACRDIKKIDEFPGLVAKGSYCKACAMQRYGRASYVRKDGKLRSEAAHDYRLKSRYGISAVQYEEMLTRQGHGCAICGQRCRSGKRLAVDHNHVTGAVRELLCSNHNAGIEFFDEDLPLMAQAQVYLARHNGDWDGLKEAVRILQDALVAA